MKKRRKHTDAFKRDAVKLMVNRGARTVEDVAKSVGVSPSLLHKWHQLYGESVAASRSQEPSQGAEDTEALRRR
ncbi:MAG TPA: transposase, partial [Polyangiaceae bacterium]